MSVDPASHTTRTHTYTQEGYTLLTSNAHTHRSRVVRSALPSSPLTEAGAWRNKRHTRRVKSPKGATEWTQEREEKG